MIGSRLIVLQHVAPETLGAIADASPFPSDTIQTIRSFDGDPVPTSMEGVDGLIVMGGPMGVRDTDRYPFLKNELSLIEAALKGNKPILGTCLGAQLLAAVLGAEVKRGQRKEIGWYPVTLKAEAAQDPLWKEVASPFTPLHWHGDIFELPAGAVSLAQSELTQHQVFRYGKNAYGFLCHLEVTFEMITQMAALFASELEEEKLDGKAILSESQQYLPHLKEVGTQVYGRWFDLFRANQKVIR